METELTNALKIKGKEDRTGVKSARRSEPNVRINEGATADNRVMHSGTNKVDYTNFYGINPRITPRATRRRQPEKATVPTSFVDLSKDVPDVVHKVELTQASGGESVHTTAVDCSDLDRLLLELEELGGTTEASCKETPRVTAPRLEFEFLPNSELTELFSVDLTETNARISPRKEVGQPRLVAQLSQAYYETKWRKAIEAKRRVTNLRREDRNTSETSLVKGPSLREVSV